MSVPPLSASSRKPARVTARQDVLVDQQTQTIRTLSRPIPETGLFHPSIFGWYIEGRIFEKLKDCSFVIRSPEAAHCDGVLLIDSQEKPEENETDRTMQLVDWGKQSISTFELLPFDVKAMSIRKSLASGTVRYRSNIVIGPKQNETCAFFLVVLRENSKYVTLMSCEMMMWAGYLTDQRPISKSFHYPRRLISHIDYIPDAIPFTFHIDQLPRILSTIREQKKQRQELTVNGISLQTKGPPVWTTGCVRAPRSDFAVIKMFHGLFEAQPEYGLKLRLVDMRPLFADFWIELPNSERVLVELKGTQKSCLYKLDGGWFCHLSRPADVAWSYFHSARPWDFVFTYNHAQDEFYCIPFDHAQQILRDDEPRSTTKNVDEWKRTPLENVAPFRINLRSSTWLQKLIDILQIRRNPPNQYDVSRLYQMTGPEPNEMAEFAESTASRKEKGPEMLEIDDDSAETTMLEDTLDAQFRSEVLDQIMSDCARTGKGLCFWLGRSHPIADFAFVRYRWSPDEQRAYITARILPIHIADLPDQTRVVLVNASQDTHAIWTSNRFSVRSRRFWRFYREVPSISLLASMRFARDPDDDEPVMFLPLAELKPPPVSTAIGRDLQKVREHYNRWARGDMSETGGVDTGIAFTMKLNTGIPTTHSIRLSQVHSKISSILGTKDKVQIGVDPKQVYAAGSYVLNWKDVKVLHAKAIHARVNQYRR